MKQLTMGELPECDVCKQAGVSRTAEFDAKTKFGPHAYLCTQHMKSMGVRLGATHLVLREKKDTPKTNKVPVVHIPLTKEFVFDIEIPHVECPHCGENRNVEMDANYTVTCEGCGNQYKVVSLV